MGRNRTLGSPYQTETVTADFTTNHAVDAYMVDAVPLVVTLDPFAVNNDQVLVQDVTNSAAAHPITINASDGQTILNGFGSSIAISSNGGSVLLTMTPDRLGASGRRLHLLRRGHDGRHGRVRPCRRHRGDRCGDDGRHGGRARPGRPAPGTTGATGAGTTGATGSAGTDGGDGRGHDGAWGAQGRRARPDARRNHGCDRSQERRARRASERRARPARRGPPT